jgi:predicted acyl esterase
VDSRLNKRYPVDAALPDSVERKGTLSFVSEPFAKPLIVSGRITASIKAMIDQRDMDLTLAVYEITPRASSSTCRTTSLARAMQTTGAYASCGRRVASYRFPYSGRRWRAASCRQAVGSWGS